MGTKIWLDKHKNQIVPGMFIRYNLFDSAYDHYLVIEDIGGKLWAYRVNSCNVGQVFFSDTFNHDIEIVHQNTISIPDWMYKHMTLLEYEDV
jgi:hypothetical protein